MFSRTVFFFFKSVWLFSQLRLKKKKPFCLSVGCLFLKTRDILTIDESTDIEKDKLQH